MKRAGGVVLPLLEAPGPPAPSLRVDVYGRIRGAILEGRLAPGVRLPSTRTLAGELGLSRTTAEEAYGQLVAEGYVARRVGDGTYVSSTLPARRTGAGRAAAVRTPPLSRRGRAIAEARLAVFDGVWIAPGSPYRSMEGALGAIRYARERGVPLVGT